MDIEEIIKDSKNIKTRIIQMMFIVLMAGILLAYFRTTQLEMWLAALCCLISIFLYKRYVYVDGFIEFLERTNNKDEK